MDHKKEGQGKEKGAKGSQVKREATNGQSNPGKGEGGGVTGSQKEVKRAPGGQSSRDDKREQGGQRKA